MTTNNLPVQLTSFIGRQREIEELKQILQATRMLTLTGSGGCGKTRLAIEVASQLVDGYPDGVWLVDLANVRDPDLVGGAFVSALGLQDTKGLDPIQLLIGHLGSETVLIIIDNCEHLIAACAKVSDALLRGCTHVCIVATSREPLGLPAETTWRVPSLSSPDETPSLEALTEYEAVELFTDRALKTRPNFRITDDNASAVAEICSRLDGIPLAVELAAARVKMLTPQQIAEGLSDRFHLLTGGSRVVMPRQQTLQASVDWSYELLTDAEKVVLDSLSVFAGGFTLDAAEGVCGNDGVTPTEVLDILERLVDKSLVLVDVDEGPAARYRLLETIRQFAMERLVEKGRVKDVRTRHMNYYVELGAAASLESPANVESSVPREMKREADNFRAAMRWALTGDDDEITVRLATQLGWVLLSLGQRREITELLDRVLGSEPSASAGALSRIWMLRGWSGFWYDVEHLALGYGERALAFAEQAGDERAGQAARVLIAQAALAARETARLEAIATEMEEHAAAGSFEHMFAICIRAANRVNAGEIAHAKVRFEEVIPLARSSDNASMLSTGQLHVGYMCLLEGDFDSAARFAEEAAATARLMDVPDPRPFDVLGLVDLYRGRYANAKERFEEGLSVARERQLSNFEAMEHCNLALVALAEGDIEAASDLAKLFETFADDAEVDLDAGMDGVFFATLYRVVCLRPERRQLLQKIRETSARPSEDFVVAVATLQEARNCRDEGAIEEADELASEALPMFRRFGTRPFVVESLELAAGLAADQESFREATRLFAAAEGARRELGYVRLLIDQSRYDADLVRVRESDEFGSDWEQGAGMTLDEAVDYAVRGRGERKRPTLGWAALTPAELKVSALVAEGLNNPSIAERLFISRHTVETHLKNIYGKLGISSRAQLAGEAVRRNLTTTPAATSKQP